MTRNQNKNSQNLNVNIWRGDAAVGFKLTRQYVQIMVVGDFRWEKIGNLWEIIPVPTGQGMAFPN